MNKLNQNLSTILDIEPLTLEQRVDNLPSIHQDNLPEESTQKSDVDEDVDYARDNIKNLIQKGSVAIDQLLHVAKESEHPRAYEVVATMIKNLSELNKDLLEIQKRKKDLSPKDFSSKSQNINVDKAVVFTGSTTELIKLIKQNREE